MHALFSHSVVISTHPGLHAQHSPVTPAQSEPPHIIRLLVTTFQAKFTWTGKSQESRVMISWILLRKLVLDTRVGWQCCCHNQEFRSYQEEGCLAVDEDRFLTLLQQQIMSCHWKRSRRQFYLLKSQNLKSNSSLSFWNDVLNCRVKYCTIAYLNSHQYCITVLPMQKYSIF